VGVFLMLGGGGLQSQLKGLLNAILGLGQGIALLRDLYYCLTDCLGLCILRLRCSLYKDELKGKWK
jgi:hypothetical protein